MVMNCWKSLRDHCLRADLRMALGLCGVAARSVQLGAWLVFNGQAAFPRRACSGTVQRLGEGEEGTVQPVAQREQVLLVAACSGPVQTAAANRSVRGVGWQMKWLQVVVNSEYMAIEVAVDGRLARAPSALFKGRKSQCSDSSAGSERGLFKGADAGCSEAEQPSRSPTELHRQSSARPCSLKCENVRLDSPGS